MQLKDVMTRNVEVADFNMTLQEAAAKMKLLDVGVLPVQEGGQLVGILTDRDIIIRAVAEGRDPRQTAVTEAMTAEPVCCYEEDDVAEAAQLMATEQIRRLPVLNREQQLVGIVSLGDLAVETSDDKLKGALLEEISEPVQTTF